MLSLITTTCTSTAAANSTNGVHQRRRWSAVHAIGNRNGNGNGNGNEMEQLQVEVAINQLVW